MQGPLVRADGKTCHGSLCDPKERVELRHDIFLSLTFLFGHFILTTTFLRIAGSMSPVLIHTLSAVIAALSFAFSGPMILAPENYNVWPGLSLISFGAMVFLFAYSAIYKSISLRLLIESENVYPDAISIERIHDEIVLPRFLDRIEMLVATNHLKKNGGLITITDRGRKLCRALNNWRTLLGFAESGLYFTSKEAS